MKNGSKLEKNKCKKRKQDKMWRKRIAYEVKITEEWISSKKHRGRWGALSNINHVG